MAARHEYVHHHSQTATSNPNVVPVGQQAGRMRADGVGGDVAPRDGVAQAVGNVFSPYVKPPRRRKDNPDKLLCQADDCNAFPMKELEYCTGHARSMGLIENWSKAGRDAPE